MLAVLLVLLALYVRAGISLWSTWQASRADSVKVMVLNSQNERLKHQHAALQARWPTEAQARLLGMAYRGERAYVVRGLPPN